MNAWTARDLDYEVLRKARSATPLLSIIIAAYNVEDLIEEAIRSVLSAGESQNQWELIVVDDASSDGTVKAIISAALGGGSVTVARRVSNGGAAVTRRSGASLARGDWLWFVDGDDRVKSKSIKEILTEISRDLTDRVIFADRFSRISAEGRLVGRRSFRTRPLGYRMESPQAAVALLSGRVSTVLWDKVFPSWLASGALSQRLLREDVDSVIALASTAVPWQILHSSWIDYRLRSSSLTNGSKASHIIAEGRRQKSDEVVRLAATAALPADHTLINKYWARNRVSDALADARLGQDMSVDQSSAASGRSQFRWRDFAVFAGQSPSGRAIAGALLLRLSPRFFAKAIKR